MKIEIKNGQCVLITDPKDKFGRADSKLVSLINRICRECKKENIVSTYHYETIYNKEPQTILKFEESAINKVKSIINRNGYPVEIVK